MKLITAKSSRFVAEYFVCTFEDTLEAWQIVRSQPSCICDRTAPIAVMLASVYKMNGCLMEGKAKIGVDTATVTGARTQERIDIDRTFRKWEVQYSAHLFRVGLQIIFADYVSQERHSCSKNITFPRVLFEVRRTKHFKQLSNTFKVFFSRL